MCYSNFDITKLGAIPENFIIRRHVPQITVLKQASLFITHGGMNSVSEAMSYGVTMLVIPFVSDQPVNGEQVARLGLGKILDYNSITSKNLKDAVFSVLSDQQILANVQAMKKAVANAIGNAGAIKII